MDAPFPLTTLEITPSLRHLVAELDEFNTSWHEVPGLTRVRMRLMLIGALDGAGGGGAERVRHWEGRRRSAPLADGEAVQVLENLELLASGTRHATEVRGYAEVLDRVLESHDSIDLSEDMVKELHRELLEHSDKDVRHRGEYKTGRNDLEAFTPRGSSLGIVFAAATPFETPWLMAQLLAWTRDVLRTREIHPLVAIALFMAMFLAIHPFEDGNGRLARLLATLLLLQAGYAYARCVDLESVFQESRGAYYLALRRSQAGLHTGTPDWLPWLTYFLNALEQERDRLVAHGRPAGDGLSSAHAMILREARDAYLQAAGLGDGGYDLPWVKLKLGRVPLAIPNTASRKRAVPLHDLHHCLTGYRTDWAGEFEISAWEIASNCRGYGFAWYINLQGMLAGAFYSPRRTWRAWVRGRSSGNLYAVGFSDALLERRVDDLQRGLRLDRPAPPATFGNALSFATALVASAVVSLGPLLLPVLAVRALLG